MIFFTADTHFGHDNIIEYCKRPYRTIAEMDTGLMQLWRDTVGDDDDVYLLGDFTVLDIKSMIAYASELTGQLHIVPGSHDARWLVPWMNRVTWLDEYTQATSVKGVRSASGHHVLVYPPLVSMNKELYKYLLEPDQVPPTIVLCHYGMRTWDRSIYNSWQLFGHSHGALPPLGMSMDVGVDCWKYRPITILQAAEKMQELRLQRNKLSRSKVAKNTLPPLEEPAQQEYLQIR